MKRRIIAFIFVLIVGTLTWSIYEHRETNRLTAEALDAVQNDEMLGGDATLKAHEAIQRLQRHGGSRALSNVSCLLEYERGIARDALAREIESSSSVQLNRPPRNLRHDAEACIARGGDRSPSS